MKKEKLLHSAGSVNGISSCALERHFFIFFQCILSNPKRIDFNYFCLCCGRPSQVSIEHQDTKIAADLLKGKVVNCSGSVLDPKRDSEQKETIFKLFLQCPVLDRLLNTQRMPLDAVGLQLINLNSAEARSLVLQFLHTEKLEKHKEVTPRHF